MRPWVGGGCSNMTPPKKEFHQEPRSIHSRLKFRVVQPVDIPRCYQLESAAHPPEGGASKSTLQHRQHHAAPFFRCVLLENEGTKAENGGPEMDMRGSDEACHHVHHSPYSQLIGYVCATKCHKAAPSSNPDASVETNAEELSSGMTVKSYSYPLKHEPYGRYLAIHSIVVQKEYQRLGVAKALLENYIKSVELYNTELDEAGINRRRNSLKAKKPEKKIERILLMSKSSMINLFVSVGFRWRATVTTGEDPLYELEREVLLTPSPSNPPSLPGPNLSPHPLMEQDCFLVDAFAFGNLLECRNGGNPAAVILLEDSPSKLISEYYTDWVHLMPNEGMRKEVRNIILAAKAVHEDSSLAQIRAEAWMQSVAKEFNQTASVFVWPLSIEKSHNGVGIHERQHSISSSISDCGLDLSYNEESSIGRESQPDVNQYFVRFYTPRGEVAICAHATLAAASVLFRWQNEYTCINTGRALSFHLRNGDVLETSFISNSEWEESCDSISHNSSPASSPGNEHPRPVTQGHSSIVRIAMDFPLRTVEAVPVGPDSQAVLAMLQRAFFKQSSVVDPKDNEDDHDTLAFSLSAHHIVFMGVTSEKECIMTRKEGVDLLVELSVDGFDMLREKSPDWSSLNQGWNGFSKGVIICCEGGRVPDDVACGTCAERTMSSRGDSTEGISADFCSRYFHSASESEDPVSEWPHCALVPHFATRLGKNKLLGLQNSERGGLVECILKESEQKVCIAGAAITTLAGKILMRA